MGINMELMRRKLASLRGDNKGNGQTSVFFKPDEGDQTIRMITPKDGDPLKEVFSITMWATTVVELCAPSETLESDARFASSLPSCGARV